MKKLLVLSLVAAMAIFGTNAMAASGPVESHSLTGNIGLDADGKLIPNGGAFGFSAGAGGAGAIGAGFIFNGTAGAFTETGSTGLANTEAKKWHNPVPEADKSIGVKSASSAQGGASAALDINVDPQGYYFIDAGGFVAGGIAGAAGEVTFDASGLGDSPKYSSPNVNGHTGGAAGQFAAGAFIGNANAESLGDLAYNKKGPAIYVYEGNECLEGRCYGYWERNSDGLVDERTMPYNQQGWTFLGSSRTHYHEYERVVLMNSNAAAGVSAGISVFGNSGSASYRYVNWDNGAKTEGMGTNVAAFTTVLSNKGSYDNDNGLAHADSNVQGGWLAAGGAVTKTTQTGPGGIATAGAVGIYSGSGQLGDNFHGSAVGYSSTSVTTIQGMNGSMSTAAAGMQVTAVSNVPAD